MLLTNMKTYREVQNLKLAVRTHSDLTAIEEDEKALIEQFKR